MDFYFVDCEGALFEGCDTAAALLPEDNPDVDLSGDVLLKNFLLFFCL